MTNRRDFIKFGSVCAATAVLAPAFIACGESKNEANSGANGANAAPNGTENGVHSGANPSASENGVANSVATGAVLNEFFTLSNGVKIPKLGLGLWRIDNDKVPSVIESAIKVGYRHFDSAQAYGNEAGTGEGVRNAVASGIKREDIFVTTKVAGEHKGYEIAKQGIDGSLQKLGLDYIDLMLIHSPQPWSDFRGGDYFEGNVEAWRALEDAHKAGKIRAIGVSNFLQKDLENIFANCTIKPMVNQVLCHIGNTPFELIDYFKAQNIVVEAYSPIAHGELLKDERIVKMAQKYGVSAPQLCIAYTLQIGTVSLPKSANPAHIASNAQVDFKISEADLNELKQMSFKNYGEHSNMPVFSGK